MFAGVGCTLVAPDQRARLLGDGAHLPGAAFFHVEHRAHVQGADRSVRVPGAARAVLGEHLRQFVGVFGEVLQRDGAVLDERNRLALALHRHHDIEAGFSHLPHLLLQACVGDLDHAAGEAELGHQLHQLRELCELLIAIVAGEFDQQNCVRVALEETVDDGLERGVAARELDHRTVHQFHCRGRQLDDMLRRQHRLMESREVAHPQGLVLRQRRKREMDAPRIGERALRTHQEMGEVVRQAGTFRARPHHVDVIALHPTQHLGPARFDLRFLAPHDGVHAPDQSLIGQGRAGNLIARAEVEFGAVGEQRIDAAHVVHHVAVTDRA